MTSIDDLLKKESPTYYEIRYLITRDWLSPNKKVLELINQGKLDKYLKTEPVLADFCWRGQEDASELIRTLVQRGADVNSRDYAGKTALHAAAFARHPALIKTLMELGANALVTDNYGKYPLNQALIQDCHSTDYDDPIYSDSIERITRIVKMLIIDGGNDPYYVYSHDNFDRTAMFDCHNSFIKDVMAAANRTRLTHPKSKQLNQQCNSMDRNLGKGSNSTASISGKLSNNNAAAVSWTRECDEPGFREDLVYYRNVCEKLYGNAYSNRNTGIQRSDSSGFLSSENKEVISTSLKRL